MVRGRGNAFDAAFPNYCGIFSLFYPRQGPRVSKSTILLLLSSQNMYSTQIEASLSWRHWHSKVGEDDLLQRLGFETVLEGDCQMFFCNRIANCG